MPSPGVFCQPGMAAFWLGTRDGLNRWNNGQITIYRKRTSGLPDDSVESIFEDDRGRIWVATGRGVAYFENGRFIPLSNVPAGRVHSIIGMARGICGSTRSRV
jgi:ligand-binding sensor domain-containing protein